MTRRHVLLGAAAWAIIVVLDAAGVTATHLDWIDELLAFAPLVIVPLGLPLMGVEPPRWLFPLALALPAALLLPEGAAAAAAAAAWLAGCVALLLRRGLPWLRRPTWSPAELTALAALAFLCVGAGWAVVSRLGAQPYGFSDAIVKLTGVHFHYAGFAALAIAAAASRTSTRPTATVAPVLIAGGSVLVAIGHFGPHVLDVAGAASLTVGLLLVGTHSWRAARHAASRPAALLRTSAVAPLLPMALALVYAFGRLEIGPSMPIERMAQVHGTLNAFAFSLAGIVGWRHVRSHAQGAMEQGVH
jgi:hypothetical protein